jgi:hypothetical protein
MKIAETIYILFQKENCSIRNGTERKYIDTSETVMNHIALIISGMIFFSYLTDFSYFTVKKKFQKFQDTELDNNFFY